LAPETATLKMKTGLDCDFRRFYFAISAVKGLVVGNETSVRCRTVIFGVVSASPHGLWASDFSTLVRLILSTYNPIRNQEVSVL